MTGTRPAWTVLLMTLLAGCGTLNPSTPTGGTDDLAAYYRYAAALDQDTLNGEYRNFRNWVTEQRCTPDRLRLTILILVAESGPAAKADPSAVLAPCLGGAERPPPRLRNLAFLLEDQIQLRRAYLQRAQELQARVDELEEALSKQRRARRELAKQKGELEKRLNTLQEQLEALKNIERSIRQRD